MLPWQLQAVGASGAALSAVTGDIGMLVSYKMTLGHVDTGFLISTLVQNSGLVPL